MYSPSGSKKSQNNGYMPLCDDTDQPASKPKQQLTKTTSHPGFPPLPPPKPRSNSTSTSELPPPSFFTSGGGASFGYYLSSVHKPKRSEILRKDKEDNIPIDINHSPFSKSRSLHGHRPNFKQNESTGSSRPQLAALPAKFRAAFEERKKKTSPALPHKEPLTVSTSLPDIGEDLSNIERRPPSLMDLDIEIPGLTSSNSQEPKTTETKSELQTSGSEEMEKSGSRSPGSVSSQLSITTSASLQMPVTFAQPPPRDMDYVEKEYPGRVFDQLSKLREKGHLCDVTLIANLQEIKAHRIVLASCSSYFESMLIGENALPEGEPIYIEEFDEEVLPVLIDFAYTSRIKISDRNIYAIFEAADVLGFSGVKSACCKFLKLQMNKSNCIGTWLFAEDQNSTELMEAALHYIESNFLDIARGREFLMLDRPEVVARIAALEDIAITSEEQVYEAILGWVTYDLEWRRSQAAQVFAKVRFPSISRDFLLHIVDHEPLIKEDPGLLQQLIDALECHVSTVTPTLRKKLKKKGSQVSSLEPRPASTAVEVVTMETGGQPLGMLVMGGADRPNSVFRQGDKPGIFVIQILPGWAAHKCGRLRVGDRILRVNSEDVSNAKHDHVINLLKSVSSPLSLLVRHEAPPPGLVWLTLVAQKGVGFGFSVRGGVNSHPGNPLDETDEGIFISQIVRGGAAEGEPRLLVGQRILQVNSQSMLGKTHDEAIQILHSVVDRMNLLCCHGFDPKLSKNSTTSQ